MARHDPELVKAFELNRANIRAALSDTAMANIAAMSPAGRKMRTEEVRMQITRNDMLASRPCNAADADHYRGIADGYRAELVALEGAAL